ncbi:uncharacterized protein [Amphiura filiformis]|uniref:uncharacterized protein isoform X2 n=1 Tax=Amphiura filiformis TaxID=82378 RepID=UPI003B2105A5
MYNERFAEERSIPPAAGTTGSRSGSGKTGLPSGATEPSAENTGPSVGQTGLFPSVTFPTGYTGMETSASTSATKRSSKNAASLVKKKKLKKKKKLITLKVPTGTGSLSKGKHITLKVPTRTGSSSRHPDATTGTKGSSSVAKVKKPKKKKHKTSESLSGTSELSPKQLEGTLGVSTRHPEISIGTSGSLKDGTSGVKENKSKKKKKKKHRVKEKRKENSMTTSSPTAAEPSSQTTDAHFDASPPPVPSLIISIATNSPPAGVERDGEDERKEISGESQAIIVLDSDSDDGEEVGSKINLNESSGNNDEFNDDTEAVVKYEMGSGGDGGGADVPMDIGSTDDDDVAEDGDVDGGSVGGGGDGDRDGTASGSGGKKDDENEADDDDNDVDDDVKEEEEDDDDDVLLLSDIEPSPTEAPSTNNDNEYETTHVDIKHEPDLDNEMKTLNTSSVLVDSQHKQQETISTTEAYNTNNEAMNTGNGSSETSGDVNGQESPDMFPDTEPFESHSASATAGNENEESPDMFPSTQPFELHSATAGNVNEESLDMFPSTQPFESHSGNVNEESPDMFPSTQPFESHSDLEMIDSSNEGNDGNESVDAEDGFPSTQPFESHSDLEKDNSNGAWNVGCDQDATEIENQMQFGGDDDVMEQQLFEDVYEFHGNVDVLSMQPHIGIKGMRFMEEANVGDYIDMEEWKQHLATHLAVEAAFNLSQGKKDEETPMDVPMRMDEEEWHEGWQDQDHGESEGDGEMQEGIGDDDDDTIDMSSHVHRASDEDAPNLKDGDPEGEHEMQEGIGSGGDDDDDNDVEETPDMASHDDQTQDAMSSPVPCDKDEDVSNLADEMSAGEGQVHKGIDDDDDETRDTMSSPLPCNMDTDLPPSQIPEVPTSPPDASLFPSTEEHESPIPLARKKHQRRLVDSDDDPETSPLAEEHDSPIQQARKKHQRRLADSDDDEEEMDNNKLVEEEVLKKRKRRGKSLGHLRVKNADVQSIFKDLSLKGTNENMQVMERTSSEDERSDVRGDSSSDDEGSSTTDSESLLSPLRYSQQEPDNPEVVKRDFSYSIKKKDESTGSDSDLVDVTLDRKQPSTDPRVISSDDDAREANSKPSVRITKALKRPSERITKESTTRPSDRISKEATTKTSERLTKEVTTRPSKRKTNEDIRPSDERITKEATTRTTERIAKEATTRPSERKTKEDTRPSDERITKEATTTTSDEGITKKASNRPSLRIDKKMREKFKLITKHAFSPAKQEEKSNSIDKDSSLGISKGKSANVRTSRPSERITKEDTTRSSERRTEEASTRPSLRIGKKMREQFKLKTKNLLSPGKKEENSNTIGKDSSLGISKGKSTDVRKDNLKLPKNVENSIGNKLAQTEVDVTGEQDSSKRRVTETRKATNDGVADLEPRAVTLETVKNQTDMSVADENLNRSHNDSSALGSEDDLIDPFVEEAPVVAGQSRSSTPPLYVIDDDDDEDDFGSQCELIDEDLYSQLPPDVVVISSDDDDDDDHDVLYQIDLTAIEIKNEPEDMGDILQLEDFGDEIKPMIVKKEEPLEQKVKLEMQSDAEVAMDVGGEVENNNEMIGRNREPQPSGSEGVLSSNKILAERRRKEDNATPSSIVSLYSDITNEGDMEGTPRSQGENNDTPSSLQSLYSDITSDDDFDVYSQKEVEKKLDDAKRVDSQSEAQRSEVETATTASSEGGAVINGNEQGEIVTFDLIQGEADDDNTILDYDDAMETSEQREDDEEGGELDATEMGDADDDNAIIDSDDSPGANVEHPLPALSFYSNQRQEMSKAEQNAAEMYLEKIAGKTGSSPSTLKGKSLWSPQNKPKQSRPQQSDARNKQDTQQQPDRPKARAPVKSHRTSYSDRLGPLLDTMTGKDGSSASRQKAGSRRNSAHIDQQGASASIHGLEGIQPLVESNVDSEAGPSRVTGLPEEARSTTKSVVTDIAAIASTSAAGVGVGAPRGKENEPSNNNRSEAAPPLPVPAKVPTVRATCEAAKVKPSRLLKETDFLQWILEWDCDWAFQGRDFRYTSGILSTCRYRRLSRVQFDFRSMDRYYEVFIPLLMLETWAKLLKDFNPRHNPIMQCGVEYTRRESGQYSGFTMCNVKVPIPKGKEKDSKFTLNDDDFVIVSPHPQSVPTWSRMFGVVMRVITRDVPSAGQQNYMGLPGELPMEEPMKMMEVTLLMRVRDPNFRGLQGEPINIQLMGSLVTSRRQFYGIMCLHTSNLSQDILRYRRMDVFGHKDVSVGGSSSAIPCTSAEVTEAAVKTLREPDLLPRVFLLQGPPGTGKTRTIISIVVNLLKTQGAPPPPARRLISGQFPCHPKILLCAPSNAAVDILVLRLADALKHAEREGFVRPGFQGKKGHHNAGHFSVIRLGRTKDVHHEVLPFCLEQLIKWTKQRNEADDKTSEELIQKMNIEIGNIELLISRLLLSAHKDEEEIKQLRDKRDALYEERQIVERKRIDRNQSNQPKQAKVDENRMREKVLTRADVICCTLNHSGSQMFKRHIYKTKGNSLEKEKVVSFSSLIVDEATQCTEPDILVPLQYDIRKLMLVGDPQQLPATVISREASRNKFTQSLFERYYRYFKTNHEVLPFNPIRMLKTQYRMHPEISKFPSRQFYDGLVQNDPAIARKREECYLHPYKIFDVIHGEEHRYNIPGAIINEEECKLIKELYHFIARKGLPLSIGIITPYQHQKRYLQQQFQGELSQGQNCTVRLEIQTVDSFQGREKDIIIMSCVRTNGDTEGIGFLADPNRLNVSLTRARLALYVVGHLSSLATNRTWNELITDAMKRGVLVPAERGQYKKCVLKCKKRKQNRDSMNSMRRESDSESLNVPPVHVQVEHESNIYVPRANTTHMHHAKKVAPTEQNATYTPHAKKVASTEQNATYMPHAKATSGQHAAASRPGDSEQQTCFNKSIPKRSDTASSRSVNGPLDGRSSTTSSGTQEQNQKIKSNSERLQHESDERCKEKHSQKKANDKDIRSSGSCGPRTSQADVRTRVAKKSTGGASRHVSSHGRPDNKAKSYTSSNSEHRRAPSDTQRKAQGNSERHRHRSDERHKSSSTQIEKGTSTSVHKKQLVQNRASNKQKRPDNRTNGTNSKEVPTGEPNKLPSKQVARKSGTDKEQRRAPLVGGNDKDKQRQESADRSLVNANDKVVSASGVSNSNQVISTNSITIRPDQAGDTTRPVMASTPEKRGDVLAEIGRGRLVVRPEARKKLSKEVLRVSSPDRECMSSWKVHHDPALKDPRLQKGPESSRSSDGQGRRDPIRLSPSRKIHPNPALKDPRLLKRPSFVRSPAGSFDGQERREPTCLSPTRNVARRGRAWRPGNGPGRHMPGSSPVNRNLFESLPTDQVDPNDNEDEEQLSQNTLHLREVVGRVKKKHSNKPLTKFVEPDPQRRRRRRSGDIRADNDPTEKTEEDLAGQENVAPEEGDDDDPSGSVQRDDRTKDGPENTAKRRKKAPKSSKPGESGSGQPLPPGSGQPLPPANVTGSTAKQKYPTSTTQKSNIDYSLFVNNQKRRIAHKRKGDPSSGEDSEPVPKRITLPPPHTATNTNSTVTRTVPSDSFQVGGSSSSANRPSTGPHYAVQDGLSSEQPSAGANQNNIEISGSRSNNQHPYAPEFRPPPHHVHHSNRTNTARPEIARQYSSPVPAQRVDHRHVHRSFSDPPEVVRSNPPMAMGFYTPHLHVGVGDGRNVRMDNPNVLNHNRMDNPSAFNPNPQISQTQASSGLEHHHQNAGIDHRGQIPPADGRRGSIPASRDHREQNLPRSILRQPSQPSQRRSVSFANGTRDNTEQSRQKSRDYQTQGSQPKRR